MNNLHLSLKGEICVYVGSNKNITKDSIELSN